MPLNFELQPFYLIDPVKQFIEALFPMFTTDYIKIIFFQSKTKTPFKRGLLMVLLGN